MKIILTMNKSKPKGIVMRKRTTYAPAPVVSAFSPNSNNNTGENAIEAEIIKIFRTSIITFERLIF